MCCASETKKATPLPLDLYMMFDSSGSMARLVAANKSKYAAVVDAMNAFLADPASDGIGVGLQFFPLNQAGVPATCTDKAQCPAATGRCTSRFCNTNGGGPKQLADLTFCIGVSLEQGVIAKPMKNPPPPLFSLHL